MEFKYQVVVHSLHYPSSGLFRTYEEAKIFYESIARGPENQRCMVTLCKIEDFKNTNETRELIAWDLEYIGEDE